MKFYKTQTDEVMAIEQGQDFLVKADWAIMTDEEVQLHLNPPKTSEQIDAEIRQAKEEALNSITVTTTSGKVFDGRDKDQIRMMSAIKASAILNITSTEWKLADNSIQSVTIDELKEALALSIQEVGNIVLGA